MESALPTVMGRALDVSTGEITTLAFDPILQFRTNTVEDPIPDGGGSNWVATDGWYDGLGWINPANGRFDQPVNDGSVHCANVRRSFLNEDGCEYPMSEYSLTNHVPTIPLSHTPITKMSSLSLYFLHSLHSLHAGRLSFDPTACTQPDDDKTPILGNGRAVVICGSPGETSNDFSLGVVDGFSLKSWHERSARREIYKDGVFTEQKYNAWFHIALRAKDQLRQRVAWALYQIVPIGAVEGFDPRTEPWMAYYDIYVRHAFGNYRDVLKEVSYTSLMVRGK
jgi:hypothetical protein